MVLAYVVIYAVAGSLAVGVSYALDLTPFTTPSWLGLSALPGALVSAVLGAMLAAGTLATTRALLRRARWARALHAALRPAVRHAGDGTIVLVAVASSVGEELVFRGLLMPALGTIASSIAFGALHQVRGTARWGWMAWAAIMGLLFAGLYQLTGSLVGPIVAHATINGVNLRLLRDREPEPVNATRGLGGLLKRAA